MKKLLESQPVKFLAVGAVNTVLGYGTFALLFLMFESIHPVVVAYLAHALVSPIGFVLYRKYVFRSNRPVLSSFLRFQSGYLIPLALNGPLLYLGIEWLGGNPLVVQAILTLFLVLVSFVFNRYFAFSAQRDSSEER